MPIADWIKNEDCSNFELLDICHTTKWEFFEKILADSSLKRDLPSFLNGPAVASKWNVVYLYYGFPFYVPNTGNEPINNTDILDDQPIGILLNPDSIKKLHKCYPFDTGAFFKGMFQDLLPISDSELDIYELVITHKDDIKKLVKRYFTTNENYKRGKVDFTDTAKDGKEQKLIGLYTSTGRTKFDHRSMAIEIHSNIDLKIEDLVDAIILPMNRSKEFPYLKEMVMVKFPNAEILEYDEEHRFGPEDARQYLRHQTINFYKAKKLL